MMADYKKPTSEWDHSHALSEGDVLIDTWDDSEGTVEVVAEDGSVLVNWDGKETERYTENSVRVSLRDGLFKTPDGLSHELATY